MISVQRELQTKVPFFGARPNSWTTTAIASLLGKMIAERELNAHLEALADLSGLDFVESALDQIDFGYRVEARELENIPAEGRWCWSRITHWVRSMVWR